MPARFTVLASGSSGNANLLEVDGFALLIDFGLQPQIIAERLSFVQRTWANVNAVILTHAHGDHWNSYTLAHLRRLNIPLYAHAKHHVRLSENRNHEPMRRAGLLRQYIEDRPIPLAPNLNVRAIEVPHDSSPTFAFRFDYCNAEQRGWSAGLASDIGHVTNAIVEAFTGIDLLAVEFNHDVVMQKQSPRPRFLIDRVLGNHGHLSNEQAADLAMRVGEGCLRTLVQLHLSKDCNTPELAQAAGQKALDTIAPMAQLVTATQHAATIAMPIVERVISSLPTKNSYQQTLPGMEHE